MERSWCPTSICTINLPECDERLIIQNGNFESHSWVIALHRLKTSLWLCGYRSTRDTAPFFIGVIDHSRCRLEDGNTGKWILAGTVLAHHTPCLVLPGLCLPFPKTCRNPCITGPCLDDDALVRYGFPSVTQTIAQMTQLSSRPLRDFSFSEVADELRRRIEGSRDRLLSCYGAVFLDKTDVNCLQSVHAMSQNLCTREITQIFTPTFVGRYRCAKPGCHNAAVERCHGPNNSRPDMFRRAWFLVQRLYERYVPLLDVMTEFLRMHLAPEAEFSLMCHACHRNADRIRLRGMQGRDNESMNFNPIGGLSTSDPPMSDADYSETLQRNRVATRNYETSHDVDLGSAIVRQTDASLEGWAHSAMDLPSRSGARGSNDPPPIEDEMNDENAGSLAQFRFARMRRIRMEGYQRLAMSNYELFHGFPPGSIPLARVEASSAGVDGWATYIPYAADPEGDSASRAQNTPEIIEEERACQ
jgi:hypothetical protein